MAKGLVQTNGMEIDIMRTLKTLTPATLLVLRKDSAIEGMKPGTLKSVTEHAESVANDLNERAGGRATSAYASRRNTPTTK